ncbi:MAG: ion channel [Actinomycetota bacterium]|nr:ion channel [Actinomycetota bacterium]
MSIIRRLYLAIFLLLFILTMGTLGYILIEKWSPLDALYMTVITISTVGFREIAPLSPVGKVFTLCLIIGGVGTVIYTLGIIVEFLAEGHLTNTNPSASTVIEAGDKLVVMGTKDQLETLQALI